MVADNPVPQVDMDALAAEAARFLGQLPAGEGIGLKLSNMLVGFLQTEVLPQAHRAADQGLDPTPLFAAVTDVLRLYTEALQRPESTDH